ncbi:MAG: endonuclease domain-containing protein [Chloroflexi bacterium]|nr:endonuclease domain-containing protein [Chloroflexota bacterium]
MNKNPFTDPIILQRAREMRRMPTEPERRLWQKLRRKQLAGYKFRRQHPIGRFIVDFYCHQARLVVEVDGGSHTDQAAYDAARTAWLATQEIRVIRFSNQAVMQNMDDVLQTIFMHCEE